MSLRCKAGDLALVVQDEPGCRANIGRVVEVRGPVQTNPRIGLQCWLIRPAGSNRRWRVTDDSGWIQTETVSWKSRVEHPDSWLVPISPKASTDREEVQEPEEREAELVLAGARGAHEGGAN